MAEARDVVFTRTTPLASSAELARRVLTPITQRAIAKGTIREQPIDLAHEQFALYVPAAKAPPEGYGLFVFVAPWPDVTRPVMWRAPLEEHRLVFVSAANAGNDASVLDRRMPLALLAAENARALVHIDPARVYVGGLSGGARVSEMLALAYPDVFRGALLNAGSEPIAGENGVYLPPADLFAQFQRTRLVYVTGERDDLNLQDDQVSRDSMRDHCVFDVVVQVPRRLGHEPLDRDSLERAFAALDERAPPEPARLKECNERMQRRMAEDLAQVRDRAGLLRLDARWAGLAAPRLLELNATLP